MFFAILIHAEEGVFERLSEQEQEAAMEKHYAIQREYSADNSLGPVVRLMGSNGAVTVRKKGAKTMVLDGPYAETKEHLLGVYVLECDSIDEAIAAAKKFPQEIAAYEVRPIIWSNLSEDSGEHA